MVHRLTVDRAPDERTISAREVDDGRAKKGRSATGQYAARLWRDGARPRGRMSGHRDGDNPGFYPAIFPDRAQTYFRKFTRLTSWTLPAENIDFRDGVILADNYNNYCVPYSNPG
jgi:hypothetical protein